MDLFIGVIDKEDDLRYVLWARAMPSLSFCSSLGGRGFTREEIDWGLEATSASLLGLAHLLLSQVGGEREVKLRQQYVADVLSCLAVGKIWMIPRNDIADWLNKALTGVIQ